MLSATQQTQEEVARTKQQLSFEVERIKQESDMKVSHAEICTHIHALSWYLWVSKLIGFIWYNLIQCTMITLYILQLEEQKFEMDQLRGALEEKIREIQLMKGMLQTCEKVCMTICVN